MADLNKSILDTLRKIWEKLCTITDLLQNPTTTPSIDPEVVCLSNDGGATVVTAIAVFDTSVNPPIATYYIDNVPVTGYVTVSCSSISKDREILQMCVDGKIWTKIIGFEGDLPASFLWLDENDAPVAAPDTLLIDNINCNSCKPTVTYYQKFYFDHSTEECTPIKEAITTLCDGTQTYQYLMEDGNGGFTDATTTIVGWDENNVFVQSCMQPTVEEVLNNPITFLLAANSSFTTTTDYLSVSYLVEGNNATITTAHNGITRILFNNESGEFKADDSKTLDNTITFTTGANSRVVVNAITRV